MIIYKEEINMENKYYIVRGDRSGVFFGQIAGRNGREVELAYCRYIGKPVVELEEDRA